MPRTDVLMDDLLAPDLTGRAGTSCRVCPHPVNAHDPVARRFCSATEAGELHRDCLCSGESTGATYGRSNNGNISDRAGRA